MCNNRNYLFVLLALLIVGIAPRVFAVDLSKTLLQASQEQADVSSLFAGKAQVSNLYAQSLHLAKQNEIVSTQQSVDQIVAYYTRLGCTNITAKDVLYVLYNSNQGFRTFFTQIVINDLLAGSAVPNTQDITKSYARFFACEKILMPATADQYLSLQNTLSDMYYQQVTTSYLITSMAQKNLGSEVFRNGNDDDSDFDLLSDMSTLGNIFFAEFKATPEILFYQLPTIGTPSNPSGGGTSGGGPQLPGALGGNTLATASIVTGALSPVSFVTGTLVAGPVGLTTLSTTDSNYSNSSDTITDSDVQQFLATTNPSAFAQADLSFAVGNQCISGATLPAPVQPAALPALTEEQYVSGLVAFIDHANIQGTVEYNLLSDFIQTYQNTLPSGTSPSGNTSSSVANSIANTYAEQAFGVGSTTCEASCLNLPLGDQMQCQLGCAQSCISQCDGLSPDDKLLCVVDCSCFMVSGPIGSNGAWDKIENMFSIKFCKVPVKQTTVTRGKIVTSLQGIRDEIASILQGLRNSGQTTKYVKSNEFLDPEIKLKLSEILDFKILVNIKPIFTQKSDAAQQRQQIVENKNLSKSILGISDASSDNYNKYVIISDIATNKANLEASSTVNMDAVVKNNQLITDAAQATIVNPVAVYQNNGFAFLSEDIVSFLDSHEAFWSQTMSALLQMLQDSMNLKQKIEQN